MDVDYTIGIIHKIFEKWETIAEVNFLKFCLTKTASRNVLFQETALNCV